MSALIGGGIAVASGWAVERTRWRREDQRREREHRTGLYADYLAALLAAREQIWHASRWREVPDDERGAMARNALLDHQIYPMRHRIALVSPPDVSDLSYQAIRRLTAFRDAVLGGAGDGDAELEQVQEAFNQTRRALSDKMRANLATLR
ncbi:hypothetical protein [Streptomyces sp. NPDC001422]|uniref:hypothetical protein n=1 Tax=Streptomyces sp. NPDC001422 TaxID=3364575 RepID=UPI0036BEBDA3